MWYGFTKRQYKIVLSVIRKTYGFQKREDRIASSQLAQMSGLEGRSCRRTVAELVEMNVLHCEERKRARILSLNKNYTQWQGYPLQSGSKQPAAGDKTARNSGSQRPIQKKKDTSLKDTTGDLVFPTSFTPEQQQAARRMVVSSGTPQNLLDELSGIINQGRVQRSSLALLRALARREKSGEFVLDAGLAVQRKRGADAAAEEQASQAREALCSSKDEKGGEPLSGDEGLLLLRGLFGKGR